MEIRGLIFIFKCLFCFLKIQINKKINFLGGKKEETETSYQTGVREFREESGGLITESDAVLIENRMFNNQNSFVVWMDQGKYSLYVILLNPNDGFLSFFFSN